jgi:toxin ParE1/3/4
MIVFLTREAENDLRRIGDWIAQDYPRRAETFVDELLGACRKLAHSPLAFPLVFGHERTGVRRRSYRSYLIFYCIGDERVEVLHVIHGARDYETILFPDLD